MKNDTFPKVTKCLLNIDGMLKTLQKKDQNICFTSDLRKKLKKATYTETKKAD